MKKTNAIVFCRNDVYGKMDFYLRICDEYEIYLFTTNYFSKAIYATYSKGKRLEYAYSNSEVYRYQKLNERILRLAKYMAEEYELDLDIFREKRKKIRNVKTCSDYDCEVA